MMKEVDAIGAQAELHHQYFLGLQLMVAVEESRQVVYDWMFLLFRRQHEEKFLSSFAKLGLIPGDGGAWFLPRVVGYSNACLMAFAGEPVKAEAALQMGLVSEVVEPEALVERAQTLAAGIAANPPHAVRLTKQLMRASQNASLDELLDKSAGYQAICHAEPDHHEAIEAFFEKRPGNYREQ